MKLITFILLAGAALIPLPLVAHAVVDLGVRFVAPEFVPAGSSTPIDVVVDGLAFDSAYGVTVDIETSNARVSSADAAWRCITSTTSVQCSAEELTAGPHPIHLDVRIPSSSTLQVSATVSSLGSFDPSPANNTASLVAKIFNPLQCVQTAPAIVGNFEWTAVPGASSYEIHYGIDGETPHLVARTAATKANVNVSGGDVTWFVRARFDACPAIDSASAAFHSDAPPLHLAIVDSIHERLIAPQSVAVDGNRILVADGAAKQIFTFDPSTSSLGVLPIYGDIVTDPPTLDGGIAIGPGDYLYDADRGTHSVRYALTPERYMYFAAGQPRNSGTVDGQGNVARFDAPAAIAVNDKGTFYITDSASNVVRRMQYDSSKFDFDVITFAGVPSQSGLADGRGAAVRFNDPAGVVFDSAGNAFVADRGNHAIRKISLDGSVSTIATAPQIDRPFGITIDAFGNLYVTDQGSGDIRKIAPNGRVTIVATGFVKPGLLAIATDGSLWIPDAGNGRLVHAVPAQSDRRRSARH